MPCEHGRQRSRCKECGGAGICEHGRLRSTCKECGGSQICEHGRQRSQCKECGGSSICEHGRRRSHCKECGGSSICEHGRRRSTCKECGGKGICEHGQRRSRCKECGGASVCEHGRQRYRCKECEGSGLITTVNTASRKRTRPCVSASDECHVCLDLLSDRVSVELVGCGHVVHQDCCQTLMNSSFKMCPYGCKKFRISTWQRQPSFLPTRKLDRGSKKSRG